MTKEMKVGLSVIAILVITFGVVVARRLTSAADRSGQTTLAGNATPTGKAEDKPAQAAAKVERIASASARPTVVPPEAASNPKPRGPIGSQPGWATAAGSSRSDRAADVGAAMLSTASPPMPDPSRPAQVDPYDRYGNPSQSLVPPSPGAANSNGLGADAAFDPLSSQPLQSAPGAMSRPGAVPSPSAHPEPGQRAFPPVAVQPGQPAGQAHNTLRLGTSQAGEAMPSNPTQQLGGGFYAQGNVDRQGNIDRYAVGGSPSGPTAGYRDIQPSVGPLPAGPLPAGPPTAARHLTISGTHLNPGSLAGGAGLRRPDGTYQVQPNDSFWVVSEKLYGTGAYFRALAEHNRMKVPQEGQLPVGEIISAPEVEELEKDYPDFCPKPGRRETLRNLASMVTGRRLPGGRTYKVQEGDTLFDIARYELGKAGRWAEIYDLNRDLLGDDYDLLTPGMELSLPDERQPTDNVTRRPADGAVHQR